MPQSLSESHEEEGNGVFQSSSRISVIRILLFYFGRLSGRRSGKRSSSNRSANNPAMPLGIVKVQIIANAPSSIKYQGPKSASKPRNEKNTMGPTKGPPIRPTP